MVEITVFLIFLLLWFSFGNMAEKRHFRSIQECEKQFHDVILISTKHAPDKVLPQKSDLVTGSVVISVDYFKHFLAVLRNLFGGSLNSYESLLDRARREAILRLKEHAYRKGSQMVVNLKLETSSISQGKRGSIGSVEVLAYGTAFYPNELPK